MKNYANKKELTLAYSAQWKDERKLYLDLSLARSTARELIPWLIAKVLSRGLQDY